MILITISEINIMFTILKQKMFNDVQLRCRISLIINVVGGVIRIDCYTIIKCTNELDAVLKSTPGELLFLCIAPLGFFQV